MTAEEEVLPVYHASVETSCPTDEASLRESMINSLEYLADVKNNTGYLYPQLCMYSQDVMFIFSAAIRSDVDRNVFIKAAKEHMINGYDAYIYSTEIYELNIRERFDDVYSVMMGEKSIEDVDEKSEAVVCHGFGFGNDLYLIARYSEEDGRIYFNDFLWLDGKEISYNDGTNILQISGETV